MFLVPNSIVVYAVLSDTFRFLVDQKSVGLCDSVRVVAFKVLNKSAASTSTGGE